MRVARNLRRGLGVRVARSLAAGMLCIIGLAGPSRAQDPVQGKLLEIVKKQVEDLQITWSFLKDIAYLTYDSTPGRGPRPTTMVYISKSGRVRHGKWKTSPVYLYDGNRKWTLQNATDTVMTVNAGPMTDDVLLDAMNWVRGIPPNARLEEVDYEGAKAFRISWSPTGGGTISRGVNKDRHLMLEEVHNEIGRRVTRYSDFRMYKYPTGAPLPWFGSHPHLRTRSILLAGADSNDTSAWMTTVTRVVEVRFNNGYLAELWDPAAIAKENRTGTGR